MIDISVDMNLPYLTNLLLHNMETCSKQKLANNRHLFLLQKIKIKLQMYNRHMLYTAITMHHYQQFRVFDE